MPKPHTLGLRIRALREKKGLTQQALANAVGCTVGHIGHIECGDTRGSIEILEAIAEALSVDVGDLLRGRKTGTSR